MNHDALFKMLLKTPTILQGFFDAFLPETGRFVDFSNHEFVDKIWGHNTYLCVGGASLQVEFLQSKRYHPSRYPLRYPSKRSRSFKKVPFIPPSGS